MKIWKFTIKDPPICFAEKFTVKNNSGIIAKANLTKKLLNFRGSLCDLPHLRKAIHGLEG